MNRACDWMTQAKSDLDHARKSLELGHCDWACFASQQAAEKALKAVHLHQGTVAWGHSVLDLLDGLPAETPVAEQIRRAGRSLDKHYIPARYPNAHPAGTAARYYGEEEGRKAVADAEQIVTWCDQILPPESR